MQLINIINIDDDRESNNVVFFRELVIWCELVRRLLNSTLELLGDEPYGHVRYT